jgi:hypothetical protein
VEQVLLKKPMYLSIIDENGFGLIRGSVDAEVVDPVATSVPDGL